jgi:diguanylate cyclase (GGDEF)-like protein/PAS domain S-box-containing protein
MNIQASTEVLSSLTKVQFEKLLDASPLGMAIVRSSDGIIAYVNAALAQSANMSADDIIGTSAVDYCHDMNALDSALEQINVEGSINDYMIQINTPDGMTLRCKVNITTLWVGDDRMVLSWYNDIVRLQEVSENIEYLDKYDTLTGLANKTYFKQYLNQATNRSFNDKASSTLLYLGIEGFKRADDNYGHQFSKQILLAVVSRIQGCTDGDFTARISDDEFALIIESTSRKSQNGMKKAEQILAAISEPYLFDGRKALLSVSIGIAHFVDANHCADNLITQAYKASQRAKYSGKNRIWLSDSANNV